MASLIDIGKSGLQSYRQALAVTGQNISNINTDGYKRRSAELEEVTANQGGISSTSNQTGLGVRVSDIRRSFDEFLLNKARSATTYSETNQKYLSTIKQLEDILLPGDANLGNMIANFFDGLQEIAASPADLAPRVAAVERGKTVANTFNQLAQLTSELKDGLEFQIQQDINDINILSKELFNLNSQLSGSSTKNAPNALLDSRDVLVDKLNQLAEVTVTLDQKGSALLTLGSSGKGPPLLTKQDNTVLGFDLISDKVTFLLEPGASNTPTSQITNGSLLGLSNAYQTIQSVESSIDNLAHIFSRDLNELHMNGIDLEGKDGKELFHTVSIEADVNPTNLGNTSANVQIADFRKVKNEPLTFTYQEEKDLWIAKNPANDIIAQGRETVSHSGFVVSFVGKGKEGDQITVKPAYNAAANISFALGRPEEFAAASRQLITADYNNVGVAKMDAELTSPVIETQLLPTIEENFNNQLSMIGATDFIRNGSVAIIPANTSNIDLISLVQQSQLSYSLTDDEISSITSMSLVVTSEEEADDGSTLTSTKKYLFSVTDSSEIETMIEEGATRDAEAIAKLINFGLIKADGYDLVTTDGVESWVPDNLTHTLQDFGGYASGKSNQLTFALADGNFTQESEIFANSLNIKGTLTNRNEDITSVQVFTKEGRHLAGSRLDDSQYAELFVEENGFNKNAVYRDDYLNNSLENGYLGMSSIYKSDTTNPLINISNDDSDTVISFNVDFFNGVDTNEVSFDGKKASASTSLYSVSLDDGKNKAIEATIYQGQVPGNTENDIAVAMASKIREKAPVVSLTGAGILLEQQSINPPEDFIPPEDGKTTIFLSSNIRYEVSNENGVYSVVGGPNNSLSTLDYDSVNKQVKFVTSSEPDDGDSVVVIFEEKEYVISKNNGEIEVTGGEENRLTAFINSGISFESNDLSRMDLNSQRTLRYQNIDYIISRDAGGSFSVSGGHEYALSLKLSYDEDTDIGTISSEIRQLKIVSNDGSLSASDIKIPGYDNDVEEITGNLEAAKRFGIVTSTNSPFLEYNFYNVSENDTTISDSKDRLKAWNLEGFDETFFSDLASDGAGGIFNLGLGDFEENRTFTETLSISQTSPDNAPVVQTLTGFSDTDIAYYAGKTITFSDGTNSVDVDFGISGTTSTLSETIALIEQADGYGNLDFTVSQDPNNDDVILITFVDDGDGAAKAATANVSQSLTSFSTFIPDTVSSLDELVEHLNTEINSNLTNADGDYVDLTGTVVDEENSIKKWVPQNHLNFQEDGENLLVTFKSSNINLQTDSEISLTVTGDSSREQEEPQPGLDIRVFEGFSGTDLETLENKAISISNGTSTLLIEFETAPSNLDDLVEQIQSHKQYDNLGFDVRAGTQALIVQDQDEKYPLIRNASISVIEGYPLDYDIYVDGKNIITTSPTGSNSSVSVNATSTSAIGERLTLTDLPDEELIIVLSGTGTRKISASFDVNPETTPYLERELTVRVASQVDVHEVIIPDVSGLSDIFEFGTSVFDASGLENISEFTNLILQLDEYSELPFTVSSNEAGDGILMTYKTQGFQEYITVVSDNTQYDVERIVDSDTAAIVEFFDTETNTSIATRTLDQFGKATAAGYQIDLNGIAAYNDQFFIASNNNGVGDNRNIQSLISRQSSDADGANTGGFQEIFGTIVAGLGSKIQSSKYAAEAAQTLKDASLEAEASYSGVNLDTEASRLIELQQAYQASARILSTARDLFDTLIQSV